MAQQMRMRGDPSGLGEGPEGAADVVGPQRRAPLGAQHQIQLDRPGWLAWVDVQQAQPRAVAIGGAGAWVLVLLVVTKRRYRKGGQAQHGLAGGRLEGADHQQPATPASWAGLAGGKLLVDAGQRLAEPDGAHLQVEVTPFQAAQLPGAGAGGRRQDGEGPKPRPLVTLGGSQQVADLLGRQ
jgi:hypothetical protein